MFRRFSLSLFLIILPLVAMSLLPLPAGAIAGSQFNNGRIIDDPIFFDSSAMGITQIQNFLNAKVPTCRAGYTCLKDYRQDTTTKVAEAGLCNTYTGATNKSSAEIINDVAKACGINPQVILVLLQKEQSLVTDTYPSSLQYRSATGYGCPDTAPCDAEYYGFFNQVFNAARIYKKYARDATTYNYRAGRNNNVLYNPNTACGSSSVYIQNQATAGLYIYTPYQPNQAALNNLYSTGDSCSAYGNRNFWRFFNDWFGTSVIGAVPSPLYKSSTGDTIYAIAGDKKFALVSTDIMQAYGLLKYPVSIVNDAFLANYTTGTPLTSTLAKKADDISGTLYLFDDGKRYPVNINDCKQYPDGSPVINTTWGLDCFNVNKSFTLPNLLIDNYSAQDINLPRVILNSDAPWKISNGKKQRIVDGEFIDVLGGWGSTRWMQNINAQQPEGKLLILNKSVVKFSGNPTIYLLSDGVLYPAPGMGEYNAYSLARYRFHEIPAAYNTSDPLVVGSNLSFCVASSGSQYFILTLNGQKIPIGNSPTAWGFTTGSCSLMSDNLLGDLPTTQDSGLYRSESGTIFSVTTSKLRPFPTIDDIKYSGYDVNKMLNLSTSVADKFIYGGAKLSPGRLFKINGQDQIRYVYSDSTSILVNSTNYPGLPYSKLITVDATTGGSYPNVGTYTP